MTNIINSARSERDRRPQTGLPIKDADEPAVVADAVLKAAIAAHPKLRYAAGRRASRLQLLRNFAPAGLVDAGIRKNLRLDERMASRPRIPVLEK